MFSNFDTKRSKDASFSVLSEWEGLWYMDECQDVSIKSSIVSRYLAADQALVFLLLLLLFLLHVDMQERVRVRSRVVTRMSRREQDGIEAEAWRQGR